VHVKATLHKPNDIEYEVTQIGDAINVTVKIDDRGIFNFGSSPRADIEITAPSNSGVELRTKNGSVEVYGIQQSGDVHTANRHVVSNQVFGSFNVATTNGRVTIDQAVGSFNVETSNGRVLGVVRVRAKDRRRHAQRRYPAANRAPDCPQHVA